MNENELHNVVDIAATWERLFCVEEVVDLARTDIAFSAIRRCLLTDERFVSLDDKSNGSYFAAKAWLLAWLLDLNLRLAHVRVDRLGEKKLAAKMSSLLPCGRWDLPPSEAIRLGVSFGLICNDLKNGTYVFPVAHVLSFVPPITSHIAVASLHSDLKANQRHVEQGFELLHNRVQLILGDFSERDKHVLCARSGLLDGIKMTLAKVAETFMLTRERIRQIEKKARKRLAEHDLALLVPLLHYIFSRRGSLIINGDARQVNLVGFIANCLKIPFAEIGGTGITVLAHSEQEIGGMCHSFDLSSLIEANAICEHMNANCHLTLSRDDLHVISKCIVRNRANELNKTERVYIALSSIGRYAHYSEVAKAYNSLFPKHQSSEHNIHAILGREQNGIVWIGIRGTYALKKWGYEHPSKGLFDIVRDIVIEIYEKTQNPVTFSTILAEVGKYRKVIKYTSLVIAAHCNPALKCVPPDAFVPKLPSEEEDDVTDEVEKLDNVLRKFEQEQ